MSSCNSYIYQPFSLKSQLMCNKGCFFPWLIQLNRLSLSFPENKTKKGLVCLLILLINDPLKRVSEKKHRTKPRVQTCANIPQASSRKQKQQVANDPLVSRVQTGSVSHHDCEKQQPLICFHAFSESNWGSDGDWYFTGRMRWGFWAEA